MSDYYNLPPKRKKERSLGRLILLLLLLLLLAFAATIWSLRFVPADDGILRTAALPDAPVSAPEPADTDPPPEPEIEAPPIEEPPPEPEPEPEVVPEVAPEPPPPLFSEARWRESARFTGTDPAGRTAEFTAYVLVGDETWTFASADSIFASGLSAPVDTAFSKLELGAGICTLNRVIAIGAASVEGTAERNTFLSRARGQALGAAIADNLPCGEDTAAPGILDLGYSTQAVTCPAGEKICPELSAPQRPIAMILAAAEDPDTDIGAALKNGIAEQEAAGASVLPDVQVTAYSGFEAGFDRL